MDLGFPKPDSRDVLQYLMSDMKKATFQSRKAAFSQCEILQKV